MAHEIIYGSLTEWIENLLSKGRIAFSQSHLIEAFPDLSETAIKRSLDRLSQKRKIVSIYRGYYLIIPPQYASMGMIPPPLYIDGFMKFLERSYYVALLSAASYHGASHQQPQEFFLITTPPAMRPTQRRGVKINYVIKSSIEEKFIEAHKVETGYLKISSPALTAFDLVQFEKRCGGLNRAATVLNELAESIKPDMFTQELLKQSSTYAIQRLGFLLEKNLNQKELAEALFETSKISRLLFYRVPLKTSAPDKGYPTDDKWKVIINTEIEIDE